MTENSNYEQRLRDLEKRVQILESIINGTSKHKPGRAPILTANLKSEIISKHENGISYSSLALEYGVSKTTICNICNFNKKG